MGSERLLVVDDDESTRRTLQLILSRKGFAVHVARNAAEAMGQVRANPVDLVFLDVRLPDASGADLVARLQELRSDIAVVMMTAFATVENAIAALNNGASAYLTKPLNVDEMLSVVRESLSKQRLVRENERLLEVAQRELAERVQAEVELERLRAVIESTTTDFVGVTKPDGSLLYVNRHGRKMVGLTPGADLSGLTVADIHPTASREVLEKVAFPAAARHGVWTGEITFKGPQGGPEALTSMTLLSHKSADGEVELFSTISRNITEQRSLERQLQAAQRMEAVGRLAGGVAHDFNNCLQVVLGNAELLREELGLRSEDPAAESLDAMVDAGERATRLVEQLLAFSRRQVQHLAPIELNEVVAGMEGMIRRLVGEDIIIEVKLDEGLGVVSADKAQLEQIVMNLVVNARDAMLRGGELCIQTSRQCGPVSAPGVNSSSIPPGEYVVLSVRDTGSGMDEETLSHIFEPFYTTKKEGQGTGLGLSTVYGIVQQSSGFIACKSALGGGTGFDIYLPQIESPEETRELATKEVSRAGRETVLLVEDEPMVRRLASRILERHGFTVLEAASGGDALVLAERSEGPIHLLLTDVIMPRMGGPQLAERLRSQRPDLRVLFMSGYNEQATDHGDIDERSLIGKPFKASQLVGAVCRALDDPIPDAQVS